MLAWVRGYEWNPGSMCMDGVRGCVLIDVRVKVYAVTCTMLPHSRAWHSLGEESGTASSALPLRILQS